MVAALSAALILGGGLAACTTDGGTREATGGDGYGFVQQEAGKDFIPVEDREPAPKLAGETLDGSELDVASLRGKAVVVNFWASWCPPCRAETPTLVELAQEYPDVAFVGVNQKDEPSPAKAFVRDFKVPYPSIVDRLGTLAAGWPIAIGLPSTVVLDHEGRIAARFTGGVIRDDLVPVLDELRGEA